MSENPSPVAAGGMQKVACNLCGANDTRELYRRSDYRFEVDAIEWPLLSCNQCGLAYVNPQPAPDAIWRYYPAHFYHGREDSVLAARYQMQADYLADLTPGRLLDVGCANGDWIRAMAKRGWTCTGLEPSPAADAPKDLRIEHAPLETASFGASSFDVITAWAVFEHLHDPMKAFQHLERWLVPGGRLIIAVTNIRSVASRWAYQEDIPRHLFVFSERSLQRYAQVNGLTLKRVVHDTRLFGGGARGVLGVRVWQALGGSRLTFFRAMKLPQLQRLRAYPVLGTLDVFLHALEKIFMPDWLICALRLSGTIIAVFEKPAASQRMQATRD